MSTWRTWNIIFININRTKTWLEIYLYFQMVYSLLLIISEPRFSIIKRCLEVKIQQLEQSKNIIVLAVSGRLITLSTFFNPKTAACIMAKIVDLEFTSWRMVEAGLTSWRMVELELTWWQKVEAGLTSWLVMELELILWRKVEAGLTS